MSAARYGLTMLAGKETLYDPHRHERERVEVSVTRQRLKKNTASSNGTGRGSRNGTGRQSTMRVLGAQLAALRPPLRGAAAPVRALLYRRLKRKGMDIDATQEVLEDICAVVHRNFRYLRWDNERERYLRYPGTGARFDVVERE
jgi:hypothetical protein